MKSSTLSLVVLLTVSGVSLTVATARPVTPIGNPLSNPVLSTSENTFDLTTFGAVGDGVTDDGPALQSALNAIAQAGGGTLFVPAGRYAIITPVLKDFTGSADSLTILGVASSTPVNTQGDGQALSHGLDLTSEFVIKTGVATTALSLRGLESLLIAEMVFIGTQEATTDAEVTLGINHVANAAIQHCEFYGLSTMLAGAIVHANNSHLSIDRTVFLGSTGNSGVRVPVVLSTTWKGLSVTETIFLDYGQRPNYFGKLGLAAAFSWISVGDAAAPNNLSPRREAIIRNVFLDEGGFYGISVIPDHFGQEIAASDLVYISDLRMNVSNLNAAGIYIHRTKRVLVERAKFGWSQRADAAISLVNVGEATLDKLECLDGANRIRASGETGRLTVVNSIYTHLDSLAQTTEVITTTEDEDRVQYVRQQYLDVLGHEPDAAGHDYWSNLLLECGADTNCLAESQLQLSSYLGSAPSARFSITGQIRKENDTGLPGVTLTLSGSQTITTQTDAAGNYRFEDLPTSGNYTVIPVRINYTFNSPSWTITTPNGNSVANFTAIVNNHFIAGRVLNVAGQGITGVTLTLSGSQSAMTSTNGNGNYSFTVPAEGDYTLTSTKPHYTFSPPNRVFNNLVANQVAVFTGALVNYSIEGRVLNSTGQGLSGATVTLSGSQMGSTTTNANGNYSLTATAEGSYTVSVAKVHYTFVPTSASFNNLSGNQTGNFTGTLNQHSITGKVTTPDGATLPGVTVSLSGSQEAIATTSVTGTYAFNNLTAGGNYTVIAARSNYNFSPPSRTFNELGANEILNFIGAIGSFSISGRVLNATGQGVSGAIVTVSGSAIATTSTDLNGDYSFLLPAAGNYTVSVVRVHYVFVPSSASLSNLNANQTLNFAGTINQHPITGHVTGADGNSVAGVTVTVSGSQSASAMTGSDGRYSITLPAEGTYTLVPSKTNYFFTPERLTFTDLGSSQVADFAATVIRTLEFSAASYQTLEEETSLIVTVVRGGDTSNSASVTYSTVDDSGINLCSTPNTEDASSGCDYIISIGTLRFAAGEMSKSFLVHIIDDGYAEGSESFEVALSNLAGATLGSIGRATVTIFDNETINGTNPIEGAPFFVRQHYLDFFNREADPAGLAFWTSQITSCGTDAACIDLKRANVSGAFFLSIEFQETGYFVYRMYRAAYGNLPGAPVPLGFAEFLPDAQQIGRGVVVGQAGFAEVLENNKQAFTADFVARPRFTDGYPTTLTPTQFVGALFTNAGITPSTTERDAAINEFGVGASNTADAAARGRALRRVVENSTLVQQEFNKAFVLMQYIGYLRRSPNDPPDADFGGYNFWLDKLNQFGGNFITAEMVKAFIVSGEYRQRFGP